MTGVILCGGRGERLRPFTDAVPKALVPIRDRPLLYHLLGYLAGAGVSRFVLCVGYRADAIEAFVKEGAEPSWEIVCVDSGDVSMTDRLRDARPHVQGQALVCYGDTLANVDVRELQQTHERRGALATLTVYPLHSPFGIVDLDASDRISTFVEKPVLPHWINIGFLLCESSALDLIAPASDMPEFLSRLAATGRLFAHCHRGRHVTVNTAKDRDTAAVEFLTLVDEPTREA
jgi:NDP-sugar pyrophosphorylase family protein